MNPPPPRSRLAELVQSVTAPLVVTLAAAALLSALDSLPSLIAGEPRGLGRASTVEEVERALRTRLVLPSYFPSTLAWPPRRIRYRVGRPGAVALTIDDRDGKPRLLLAETTGPGPIPPQLVPPSEALSRSPVAVGPLRGILSRVVDDGNMAFEVTFELDGRRVLLRSRGSLDELLRMAKSTREAP
jgi:hypothetical protein